MENARSIVGVAPDLYFLADCIERVREELIDALTVHGGITTGEFRDRYQTSRSTRFRCLDLIALASRYGSAKSAA